MLVYYLLKLYLVQGFLNKTRCTTPLNLPKRKALSFFSPPSAWNSLPSNSSPSSTVVALTSKWYCELQSPKVTLQSFWDLTSLQHLALQCFLSDLLPSPPLRASSLVSLPSSVSVRLPGRPWLFRFNDSVFSNFASQRTTHWYLKPVLVGVFLPCKLVKTPIRGLSFSFLVKLGLSCWQLRAYLALPTAS